MLAAFLPAILGKSLLGKNLKDQSEESIPNDMVDVVNAGYQIGAFPAESDYARLAAKGELDMFGRCLCLNCCCYPLSTC